MELLNKYNNGGIQMVVKSKELAVLIETKINRTIEGLTLIAEKFLMEAYGIELLIPIKINGRLTSCYGQFVMEADGTPLRIDIAKRVISYGHDDSLMNTLIHECIHYAFEIIGKSKHNYDKDSVFKAELIKHNAPPDLENQSDIGLIYNYNCIECKRSYSLTKKMKSERQFICHCRGTLKLKTEYISDGFNLTKVIK